MPGIRLLSLVHPLADIPPEARQRIFRGTLSALWREVAKVPSLVGVDLVARMLAANDLGRASHFWNETVTGTLGTANTYENSGIDGTTANDRIIGIYGVYVASSQDSVGSLRFVVGGKRSHQWDLQSVLADGPWGPSSREQRTLMIYHGENEGALHPVIIPPSTSILIQHYVRGAAGVGVQPAELVFLGYVLEPVGGGGAALQPLAGPMLEAMETRQSGQQGRR